MRTREKHQSASRCARLVMNLDVEKVHSDCGMKQKLTKLAVPPKVKTSHSDVDYSSRQCYWFLPLILVMYD